MNINSLSVIADEPDMAFLFAVMLLFLTSISAAQECSCPAIQCDPCQRRMVIGTEKLMCSAEKSVVCQNVVCENVDNYFQCLHGSSAKHVPAENLMDRMTDPRLPASASPQTIELPGLEMKEFQHFNTIETTVSPEEKPGVGILRGPASRKNIKEKKSEVKDVSDDMDYPWLKAKTEPELPLLFYGLYNASLDGKRVQPVKAHKVSTSSVTLSTFQKQVFTVEYGKTRAKMIVAKNSEIKLVKEDKHLVLYPAKGQMWVRQISAQDMLIFDMGEWRIGKTNGDFRWGTKDNDAIFFNAKESALLRRDQLIAKSEEVAPGTELVVSAEYGIVHADQDVPVKDKEFRLNAPVKATRVLASTAIANDGCMQPKGEVQQCAWKCFGGKGKSCQNSESTQCVRFTCSLGGEWKLPTRVSGKECRGQSVVVSACN